MLICFIFLIESVKTPKNILLKLIREEIIKVESQNKYLDHAFKIALNNGITIYDALYIAQAVEKQAELLTSDKKQAITAEKQGVDTIYIP